MVAWDDAGDARFDGLLTEANRAKGRALQNDAATRRCAHVARSRGVADGEEKQDPGAQEARTTVIWTGVRPPSRESLIHRTVEPQSPARIAMGRSALRPGVLFTVRALLISHTVTVGCLQDKRQILHLPLS